MQAISLDKMDSTTISSQKPTLISVIFSSYLKNVREACSIYLAAFKSSYNSSVVVSASDSSNIASDSLSWDTSMFLLFAVRKLLSNY